MIDWKNPNYVNILAQRQERLIKINADRKLCEAHFIHYASNPADFINDWMFTYDPMRGYGKIPFILFEKQIDYINWLNDRLANKEDGLVEKSREMGATWLNCAYAVSLWLFRPEQKIGFGSRKEALVDKIGDMDSIFEKMRFILQNLPKIFLPKYQLSTGEMTFYNEKKDAPSLRLINRQNGSAITGESGDNIGRGGRTTMYFKDESAFYERPERIEAALSQNSDVKIDVSTPNGAGNPFYQKRVGGKIPVFTFHWKDDPRKDQAWYDKKVEILDPVIIAQEIDIDYEASMGGAVIEFEWLNACVNAHKVLGWEPSGMKRAGFDVSEGKGDTSALTISHGNVIQSCREWSEDSDDATKTCYTSCQEKRVEYLTYDAIGVGASSRTVFKEISKYNTNKIRFEPFVSSETPVGGMWEEAKKNVDMFANIRAMAWWNVRRRAYKTWRMINGHAKYPIDELISLIDDRELLLQLSQPRMKLSGTGKQLVESKEEMKKRGIKSPNKADSLIYCLAEPNTRTAGAL